MMRRHLAQCLDEIPAFFALSISLLVVLKVMARCICCSLLRLRLGLPGTVESEGGFGFPTLLLGCVRGLFSTFRVLSLNQAAQSQCSAGERQGIFSTT